MYLLSSLVFVVSALLEFTFVVLLNRVPSPCEKKLPDGTLGKEINFNYAWLSREKISCKENSTSNMLEMGKERRDRKNMVAFSNMPRIHVVDLVSFCLYIFFFLSFNGVYWMHYQS